MGASLAEVIRHKEKGQTSPGSPLRSAAPVTGQPSRNWLNQIVLLVFLGLLGWGVYQLSLPGTLPIKHVRITGDFRQLQPEHMQTLVTNEVRGGFFNVNVGTIRDTLLQDPWVQDVVVQRVWPETLRVRVVEHRPMTRWGEKSLLNSEGQRFTPAPDTIPEGLPQLNGPGGSEALLLRRFHDISQRLEPLGLQVTRLEQDPRRSWRFAVDAGFQVMLGRKEFARRLDRFVERVPQALGDRIGQVDEIDMRYTNGFSVRWKKQELNQSQ